jgi:hypothetical protein
MELLDYDENDKQPLYNCFQLVEGSLDLEVPLPFNFHVFHSKTVTNIIHN